MISNDQIISNIRSIILCIIIKYYFHLSYLGAKPQKKEPITQYKKPDRVYKSPKSIRNKVN